ncbi:MAG TPA: YceI family protein [Burkholderiales bacterium]|jgi:polyisoprenoid-binding protein YceI|nr:YceI family protein [Burkholderiales bacterium]
MRPLELLCLAAAGLPLLAQAQTIDYARSEIVFISTQMNVPVEGRFRKFTAQIRFDPKNLAASQAQIEVDLGSVDTGSEEADSEVKKKGWFNLAAFPTAKFVSTGVRQLGPDRFEAQGKLTIKGITRDITAPFTVKKSGTATAYEGGFTLLRLQFKIGEGVWSDTDTVADEVQVRFRIVQSGTAG